MGWLIEFLRRVSMQSMKYCSEKKTAHWTEILIRLEKFPRNHANGNLTNFMAVSRLTALIAFYQWVDWIRFCMGFADSNFVSVTQDKSFQPKPQTLNKVSGFLTRKTKERKNENIFPKSRIKCFSLKSTRGLKTETACPTANGTLN